MIGSHQTTKLIMNRYIIIALAAVGIFAIGCSTTTFTEYRGQGVVEGKSGALRKVDGIDFWENGGARP